MTSPSDSWRVRLARELTQRTHLSAEETLKVRLPAETKARRLGITGPPGAGKSTLIGQLVQRSVRSGAKVGVLAVDPTSPSSGGSLLGDRIRMDDLTGTERAFIRSVASGVAVDGLCPNIVHLLSAFDDESFDELILETVGIGQVSYTARQLVDTFVLVLVPESGDTVQAMKAGIIETADIIVVNKADRPGANRLISELRSVGKWQSREDGWKPLVLSVSATQNEGIDDLRAAIDLHRTRCHTTDRKKQLWESRRHYHVTSTIQRRVEEILRHAEVGDEDIAALYNTVVQALTN